jgi:hypothetical protein
VPWLGPELYGPLVSTERLYLDVVGWLLRHVRPSRCHDGLPPPVIAESFRLPRVSLGLLACSLQVTLGSTQWRGSGGPGLAAITLTRAWTWS